MSQATITLFVLCVIAFAVGVLSNPKGKFLIALVLMLPLTAVLSIFLVSSREHVSFQQGFANLLAFDAHAARASLGLYAVLALFCFAVGAVLSKVRRNAT